MVLQLTGSIQSTFIIDSAQLYADDFDNDLSTTCLSSLHPLSNIHANVCMVSTDRAEYENVRMG